MKNKYARLFTQLISMLMLTIILDSCVSVEAYQKMYINDEDMKLGTRKVEMPEKDFQTYREGASGGDKGKSSGGCGCN